MTPTGYPLRSIRKLLLEAQKKDQYSHIIKKYLVLITVSMGKYSPFVFLFIFSTSQSQTDFCNLQRYFENGSMHLLHQCNHNPTKSNTICSSCGWAPTQRAMPRLKTTALHRPPWANGSPTSLPAWAPR